jgi:hypothetical protein
MKSKKNKNNKRFNFLLNSRLKKYIEELLFPDIKNIDATNMRNDILNNNKNSFLKYLPKKLSNLNKNKIWKIVNT